MQLTGAEIIIECLKEQGVDTVFGYPGGAILNVYDELYKHKDEIRHILTSHEQGASLNVYINTKSMKDRKRAEELNQLADSLREEYEAKADRIFEEVSSRIR